jgi:hypothetical protein
VCARDDGKMVGEKVGLGLAFYRAEGEGETAAEAVRWELAGAPLMAAVAARWRAVVGQFRGRGRGEAAVGEWGGALMARRRRRTGAGRLGRRGRPAAVRPLEGERRRWRLGTGPTGGPRPSEREKERGVLGRGGRAGPRGDGPENWAAAGKK